MSHVLIVVSADTYEDVKYFPFQSALCEDVLQSHNSKGVSHCYLIHVYIITYCRDICLKYYMSVDLHIILSYITLFNSSISFADIFS